VTGCVRAHAEETVGQFQFVGCIEWWFDGKILPSAEWDKEIRREPIESDMIVCLISTPYLCSKYIKGMEMRRALTGEAAGQLQIVPVLLEDRPLSLFRQATLSCWTLSCDVLFMCQSPDFVQRDTKSRKPTKNCTRST
jgi:hypothetical protein